MTAGQALVTTTVFAIILGILLVIVNVIVLLIRAVRKKKVKASLIFLLVGFALAVGGVFGYLKSSQAYVGNLRSDLDARRLSAAELGEDGKYYFKFSDFTYTDDKGDVFDNSSFSQYKYTFVNHWEPWCSPCKMELPDLEKLYEDYKDKGINFVGIYSTKEDAEAVIAEYGITYPTVFFNSEEENAFDLVQTSNVPVSFIVDSEGRLVHLFLSDEDLAMYTDANTNEVLLSFYDCVVAGTRTYDYWAEKLDALLN